MPEIAALELQIGANVDKAIAGVRQFDKSIFQLQEQLKDLKAAQDTTLDPKQFVQYGQKIKSVTQQIKDRFALMDHAVVEAGRGLKSVERPIEQTTRQMQAMGKRSSSATNSLFSLAGVVQDAPFGFRAIANNIQFFAQEMAYTTKTAGGFKGALKAMGGAMLGPAGIVFAISTVTSLLDYFLSNTHRAASASDKFKQSIDDLKHSIETEGDAFSSGLSGSAKRLTTLKLLYAATQDNTRSLKDRIAAAKQLQNTEPATFKAFSAQAIVVGKASKAYESLTNNVIRYAEAQGLADTITKNAQKGFEVQGKILDLSDKIKDARSKNISAIAQFNASFDKLFPDSGLKSLGERINKVNEFLRSPENVNKAVSAGLVNRADINLLTSLSAQLAVTGANIQTWSDEINQLATAYGELYKKNQQLSKLLNPADLTKPPQTVATAKPESQSAILKRAAANVNSVLQTTRANYAAFTKAASATVGDTITVQFTKIGKAVKSVEPLLTAAQIRFEQFQTRLKDGMAEAAQVIRNGMQDAIAGITEGFASGGFAGAAQALMNTLGDIAIQLGKIAIGVGIGIQGIKLALDSLNPIAAIAAGVGLIALGALAKTSVKNLAFADGGVVYGPTNALIGEYAGARSNPEVVAPLSKLKEILGNSGGSKDIRIAGEFRIQGNDLVAAVNNTNNRNGRING